MSPDSFGAFEFHSEGRYSKGNKKTHAKIYPHPSGLSQKKYLSVLANLLQIWDAVPKAQADKETPLSDFFIVITK